MVRPTNLKAISSKKTLIRCIGSNPTTQDAIHKWSFGQKKTKNINTMPSWQLTKHHPCHPLGGLVDPRSMAIFCHTQKGNIGWLEKSPPSLWGGGNTSTQVTPGSSNPLFPLKLAHLIISLTFHFTSSGFGLHSLKVKPKKKQSVDILRCPRNGWKGQKKLSLKGCLLWKTPRIIFNTYLAVSFLWFLGRGNL